MKILAGGTAIAAVTGRRADNMVVSIAASDFGMHGKNDEIFYHPR